MTVDEIDEELDEKAASIAYGPDRQGRERTEPCVYGHFDCAYVEGGGCANELCAKLYGQFVAERERSQP